MADVARPPRGCRLLAVVAHPDDEALACGGTLARAAEAGHRVTVVSATRGGAGRPLVEGGRGGDARLALMAARELELRAAAALLGVDRVEVLGYRDGFLQQTPPGTLDREIANVVSDVRPDALVTFGLDGLYWHPDHVAIWERTTAAVRAVTNCRPAVYHVVLLAGAIEGLVAAVRAESPEADERLFDIPPRAFGLLAPPPTLALDVTPVIDRKLAAIRAHASQLGPSHPLAHVGRDVALAWIGAEYFRLAPDSPSRSSFLDTLGTVSPA